MNDYVLRCSGCGHEIWDNPNRVDTRCLRKPKGKECTGWLRRKKKPTQSDTGDGKSATVISVVANTITYCYTWWTRFKRWCWEKWHWRMLRDQEADLRRRFGVDGAGKR